MKRSSIILGVLVLLGTQYVGAYTLKTDYLSVYVSTYGEVTKFIPTSLGIDLLEIQEGYVGYQESKDGPLTVEKVCANNNWLEATWERYYSPENAYLKTKVYKKWGQCNNRRKITVYIETKIMDCKPYYDQRWQVMYESGPAPLWGVRFFKLIKGEPAVYGGGNIVGSVESASASIWKCVNNTISSWGSWYQPWSDPESDFLYMCGPNSTWMLGGRGISSVGDPYEVGEYGDVVDRILRGDLSGTPHIPFISGPFNNPTFARQWTIGKINPYPTIPYAQRTDLRTEGVVPEPMTILLFTAGVIGLAIRRRL